MSKLASKAAIALGEEGVAALGRKTASRIRRAFDPLMARLALKESRIVRFALRVRLARVRTLEDALDFVFDFRTRRFRIALLQERPEITVLLERLRKEPPHTILELGTWRGGTLFLFTRVASDDALLLSVDLPGGDFSVSHHPAVEILYRSFARKHQRVELVIGDSHDPATLDQIRKRLDEREIDFLLIDADHSYEGVKQDFEVYGPLVREGGLIAFHDIVPGSERFVGGVPRFWAELKSTTSWQTEEYVADWQQGRAGIGVVQKSVSGVG
jgi:predicted O-methyltransferase YrrM